MAGALVLSSACGKEDPGTSDGGSTTNKDATSPSDTGGTDPDGGVTADTGVPRDSGIRPDTGIVRDSGVVRCNDNEEGCNCTPDMASPQGSCTDPALTCATLSAAMATVPANICLRACTTDTECAGSTVGNMVCRPLAGDGTFCVTREVADGQTCNRSRKMSRTMTGCAAGSLCIAGTYRDAQGNLDYERGSCGRGCVNNTGCAAPNAFCNPQVLNSTVTPGICTDKPRHAGGLCDQEDITKQCDTTIAGNNSSCVSIPNQLPNEGICIVFCDPTMADVCAASATNPGKPSVCKQVLAQFNDFGVCSDDCTAFPDDCTGQGEGQGMSCVDGLQFEANPPEGPVSFCYDVQAPTIGEVAPGMITPCATNQTGDPLHCVDGTFCATDGMGNSGCVRGCTTATTAMVSGCVAATSSTCVPFPNDVVGTCQ